MPTKLVIGKEYGWLTAESATEKRDYRGRTLYRCICRCGGVRLVAADRLLAGSVLSCGCLQRKSWYQLGGSKEQEAARIAKVMQGSKGIYQKGDTYIAQIKIDYKTHHIGSYRTRDEALQSRQAVVRARIKDGNAAAIACIAELKKARRK